MLFGLGEVPFWILKDVSKGTNYEVRNNIISDYEGFFQLCRIKKRLIYMAIFVVI